MIDDQVHFREPGLTHKGDIASESRAAAAGGITSYMEMPNTIPPALTIELLEEKYARAQAVSAVNYSFFLGTGLDNLEHIKRMNPEHICGNCGVMSCYGKTGQMGIDTCSLWKPETVQDNQKESSVHFCFSCVHKGKDTCPDSDRYIACNFWKP
jgi:dihydroorotase-like cyclic amidohydrolase